MLNYLFIYIILYYGNILCVRLPASIFTEYCIKQYINGMLIKTSMFWLAFAEELLNKLGTFYYADGMVCHLEKSIFIWIFVCLSHRENYYYCIGRKLKKIIHLLFFHMIF